MFGKGGSLTIRVSVRKLLSFLINLRPNLSRPNKNICLTDAQCSCLHCEVGDRLSRSRSFNLVSRFRDLAVQRDHRAAKKFLGGDLW